MDGQELYEIWQGAQADEGVEVDPWDMLDESDKTAWNILGQRVNDRIAEAADGELA